jgi:hypothetical protein
VRKLFIAVVAGFAASSQGQLIVGNDQSGISTFYHVDVATGVATPILSGATVEAKPWGVAYDPATNTLYWTGFGFLFKASPSA